MQNDVLSLTEYYTLLVLRPICPTSFAPALFQHTSNNGPRILWNLNWIIMCARIELEQKLTGQVGLED